MIKLTEKNGDTLLVRADHIQAAQLEVTPSMVVGEKASSLTTIFLTFGLRFKVLETPEEILSRATSAGSEKVSTGIESFDTSAHGGVSW